MLFTCFGIGPLIGQRLQAMHEEKGVKFILGDEAAEMIGDDEGKLAEVTLTSGQVLPAHVLLAGIGVLPCTEFLRASDIILDGRGYVPVDEVIVTSSCLRISFKEVSWLLSSS